MARRDDAIFGRGDFERLKILRGNTAQLRQEQEEATKAFLSKLQREQGFDAQTLTSIEQSITQVRQLNFIKGRLDTPGLTDQQRQFEQTRFQTILSGPQSALNGLRQIIQEQGFDASEFNEVFKGFADVGVELQENEAGGIDVTPPADIVQPPAGPTTPELPPAPPPLEDVLGQPPTTQPPGTPGQPPIAIEPDLAPPGVAQPTQPGLATTPPPGVVGSQQAGVAQPGQTTIAVPDPRNPGQLIEVPVVDRGIPGDIEKQADQFLLEREGLRQQEQQRQAFEAQRGLRSQRLGETSSLLEGIAGRQFREAIPGAAEVLQSQGLLQTSELEASLAREQARLTSGVQESVAAQALQDRQAEVSGIGEILSRRQAFQTAGLQREFSLEDFEKAARVARETGASVTPQVGGGGALSGLIGGAGTGAAAGGAIGGPTGAAIGAGLGGVLGGVGGGK